MEGETGRAAHLRDVDISRRIQVTCAWCGVGFVVLLFGGWGLIGGFIPMLPPDGSPERIAELYSEHADLRRFGLILGMIGVFLTVPFFFAISMQMRRAEERRVPMLAMLQFASGLLVTVVLMIPMLLFLGASYRPERTPELTQLVNELSYLMLILPWPPIIGQLLALSIATLADRSPRPVFPRWSAYFNLWVAVLLTPASMIVFFQSGPFAWAGLLGFWIPAAVFGAWYPVMTWLLLRAIGEESRAAAAAATEVPAR
ncbi:hypothetical protein DSM112329_03667 [Paraconexibacter sp. AEG42_29]|uniref:DUF4386 domain-containing protein n=1 Tax=Paraconexibacter sp. AEG42_29 TaxID=2997339 RepID=A0AAU7AYJ7_9ACTN